MNFKKWLHQSLASRQQSSRSSRRGKSQRRSQRGYAPQVFRLEDRLMMAVFMITNGDEIGVGSLAYAINSSVNRVNGGTGDDVIQFAPALDGGTITLAGDFLNPFASNVGATAFQIRNNTTITIDGVTGMSQGVNIARSGPAFRFFYVDVGSNLTLKGLTLTDGIAQGLAGGNSALGGTGGGSAGMGGAIFNRGNLTIEACTLADNDAVGGAGGSYQADLTGRGGGGGGGLTNAGQASISSINNNGGFGGGNGGGNGGASGGGAGSNGGIIGSGGGGGGAGLFPSITGGSGGKGSLGGGGGGGGSNNGAGGAGGFGAGGGGGADHAGVGGAAGYGGGAGHAGGGATFESQSGTGGGGAGMGGAIFNEAGVVTIVNSTFTANAAVGGAGGTAIDPARNGSAGQGLGGAIFNRSGTITITNSTIAANTVAQGDGSTLEQAGSGVFSISDTTLAAMHVNNTIISHVGAPTVDDYTSFAVGAGHTSTGNGNLMGKQLGFLGGVVSNANPLLGPLQENGGLTRTMALLAGSPAINQGIDLLPGNGIPATDQRGLYRDPTNIDIGAYEFRFVASMIVNAEVDETNVAATLSLREAIELANGTRSYDSLSASEKAQVTAVGGISNTITFANNLNGKTLTLTTVGSGRVGPTAFPVASNIVVSGPAGNSGVTLSAAGTTMRLFDVTSSGSLTVQNLTLTGGTAQGFAGGDFLWGGGGGGSAGLGGAIFNQGTLQILNSTLTANIAQGGAGGTYNFNLEGNGGSGGGGLNGKGANIANNNGSAGGGPNGGAGGGGSGEDGGFGGGAGGGSSDGSSSGGQPGGIGGYGGGGGGGGYASSFAGIGGAGGFGGGAGGNSGGPGRGAAGGNGGAGMGGAIFNEAGVVIISNSTLAANAAVGGAGGVGEFGGNSAGGSGLGGALFNHNGAITISSSTISANVAAQGGRGVYNLGGDENATTDSTTAIAVINNTIIGQAAAAGEDFTGATIGNGANATSGAYNLIRTSSGFAGAVISTADPKLGPLQNNGGPTRTMALLAGSPAIDAGNPSYLPPPSVDQRGGSFARVLNGRIDVGAYEGVASVAPSADFNASGRVDGHDFLAWQRSFGITAPNATKANGDADNDSDVDAADLAVWKTQFGTSGAVTASAGESNVALAASVMAAPMLPSSEAQQTPSANARPATTQDWFWLAGEGLSTRAVSPQANAVRSKDNAVAQPPRHALRVSHSPIGLLSPIHTEASGFTLSDNAPGDEVNADELSLVDDAFANLAGASHFEF